MIDLSFTTFGLEIEYADAKQSDIVLRPGWKFAIEKAIVNSDGTRAPEKPHPDRCGGELNSPVYRWGDEAFDDLAAMIANLEAAGATINWSVGCDVHIGVEQYGVMAIKQMLEYALLTENALYDLFDLSHYWRKLYPSFAEAHEKKHQAHVIPEIRGAADEAALKWAFHWHYGNGYDAMCVPRRNVNFFNWWTYKTVEFRFGMGTLDLAVMKDMVEVYLRWVAYANDPANAGYTFELGSPPATVDELKAMLGLEGRELKLPTRHDKPDPKAEAARAVEALRSEALASTTFGVELEFTDATRGDYPERHGWTWKTEDVVNVDGSACKDDHPVGGEMASPIYRWDEQSLDDLETQVIELVKVGARVNWSCALHVHLGVDRDDLDVLKRLLNWAVLCDPIIADVTNVDHRRRKWTACSWAPHEREDDVVPLLRAATSCDEFREILFRYKWGQALLRRGINLASLWKHGTVELRYFQGSLDFDEIKFTVEFSLRWLHLALNSEPPESLTKAEFKKLIGISKFPFPMSAPPPTKKSGASSRLHALTRQLPKLRGAQSIAMRHWVEPDWDKLDPVVVAVHSDRHLAIAAYYRHAVSSEPQVGFQSQIHPGRVAQYIAFDQNSGLMLGYFMLQDGPEPPNGTVIAARERGKAGDPNAPMAILAREIGWSIRNSSKYAANIMAIGRCLPTQPFGMLCGGKLLALLAISREVLEPLEMRYSFPIIGMHVKTLKPRSSQYNRLEDRGVKHLGSDNKGHGHYLVELRRKGYRFLCDDVAEKKMSPKSYTAAEQIAYWRERWYEPRLERIRKTQPEVLTWDPHRYTVARLLDDADKFIPEPVEESEVEPYEDS